MTGKRKKMKFAFFIKTFLLQASNRILPRRQNQSNVVLVSSLFDDNLEDLVENLDMASFQNLQSMPPPTITQPIIEATSHNMEVAVVYNIFSPFLCVFK